MTDQADHVFELTADGRAWVQVKWAVQVARPDGTLTDAPLRGDAPAFWVDPEPFESAGFDSFGIRGFVPSTTREKSPVPSTVTLRWDSVAGYTLAGPGRRPTPKRR